jgi:hypothetical protein
MASSCEHGNEHSGSIKCGGYFDQVNEHQLLLNDYVLVSIFQDLGMLVCIDYCDMSTGGDIFEK